MIHIRLPWIRFLLGVLKCCFKDGNGNVTVNLKGGKSIKVQTVNGVPYSKKDALSTKAFINFISWVNSQPKAEPASKDSEGKESKPNVKLLQNDKIPFNQGLGGWKQSQ